MTCNRCLGKGVLNPALGTPDPKRNTHAPYTGKWIRYPSVKCPACRGRGVRRDYPNTSAGWSIVFNTDGYVISKKRLSLIRDTNQGEIEWTHDGNNHH